MQRKDRHLHHLRCHETEVTDETGLTVSTKKEKEIVTRIVTIETTIASVTVTSNVTVAVVSDVTKIA